jgi:hypothetical protein
MNKFIISIKSISFQLLIISFLFASCKKVINIDLNSSDPRIIIEGTITDQPGQYTVKISQSANFDATNNFPGISNANVTITDNLGNAEKLAEKSAGVYVGSVLKGAPGRTYTLKIIADGKEYTATSTMPNPVIIDFLNITTQTTRKSTEKNLSASINDPAGVANYYRFIKIINNVVQTSILIEDDLMQDGNTVLIPLLSKRQTEDKIISGDNVTVVLQAVDENVYNCFRTLLQLYSSGGGPGGMLSQSTSPANPLTNISNGALGYFSACAVTTKMVVVQ